MTTDGATFARRVAEQQEQILQHLARLGLTGEFSADIPDPDPDSPLAEMLVATRIVAENLLLTARERGESLRQLQEKVQTIERQAQAILELSTPVIQGPGAARASRRPSRSRARSTSWPRAWRPASSPRPPSRARLEMRCECPLVRATGGLRDADHVGAVSPRRRCRPPPRVPPAPRRHGVW